MAERLHGVDYITVPGKMINLPNYKNIGITEKSEINK